MRLTNQQAFFLHRWLDMPLHGEECRTRNRVIALIENQVNTIEKKRQELLKKFAKKDADGKIISDPGTNKVQFEEDQETKFHNAYEKMMAEETEYTVTKHLKLAKKLLLEKMTRGMGIAEGAIYDEVLTLLEKSTE